MEECIMRFRDRAAIVTGAANGIGRATALRLAGEGAKVALWDVDQAKVDGVAETIHAAGGAALPLVVDISKSDEVKAAVARTLRDFSRIDILVNNAGIGWHRHPRFQDAMEADWERILDVNVRGTMYCTHAVLDPMIERNSGRIVNVTSIAAKVGIPGLAVYSASKGAIVLFTKSSWPRRAREVLGREGRD
jgi:NAD(P)-dependent dehydrogenase (short-subunit alcohol dehydrogenase family)